MKALSYVGFFVVFSVLHVQCRVHLLTTIPSISLLGKRNLKHSHNAPLVVLLDAGNNHKNILNVIDNEDYELKDEDVNNPEDDAKFMFYQYLRTSPEDNKDPEIKQQKEVLRAALRKRCQNVLRCRRECGSSEEDKYCPVNCKDVFDKLNLCEPPKKKKYDPCAQKPIKCGKTMPPKWKF